MIASTAIVSPRAEIGRNVSIGHYTVVDEGVVLEDGVCLAEHVVVRRGTHLKAHCKVDSFCVLGGLPQDLHFDASKDTGLIVGENTVLREGVTLHRSTQEGSPTEIGANGFLMGYSHVAHDCKLGHNVILANSALLGGHVKLADYVFIGGNTGIHQHIHVGESAIVSGSSAMSCHVPPFSMTAERNRLAGLNLVGLKRRGFSSDVIADIKQCFFAVYHEGDCSLKANAERALADSLPKTPQGAQFLTFFVEQSGRFVQKKEHLVQKAK
ncbi:MAG: acyl-[acyl-carrier-protein]--UDP-N-acetylglucosamine O-acyltransferase [Verrucomicrobia bacterium GWF2_51_19]|nr:MAG: acyl-[acyl-carrier-protein]--UDP-N-acetylglucosamine O-acyltransferase [Verrucomicrobia bacterium GWF2_51_19]HCJ12193.1 acyl-ACP--UDP-N-acetylglucosamine O-acyltransferase [Opitutae bacterium]